MKVKGVKKVTDKVKLIRHKNSLVPLLLEVYSASCLYLISCVQTMWWVKGTHSHYPFVLNILQPLTFRTPASHTSPMAHLCQLLLRGHHRVQEGPGQMPHISSVVVGGTPLMEMFIEACIGFIPAQTSGLVVF